MSIRNRVLFGLAGFAVLVVMAAIGGAIWLRSSLPDLHGSVRVPGIATPVNIIRDANGIPHIFAAREQDAYFALGFVHASDRMWQMDLMRRLGAGRLSEIFGEAALGSDKTMRTLGLHRLAGEAAASLPPVVVQILQSYADGVNAWLEHADQSLPPEFAVLRYRPEPWQPADSLVWGKLMAWQLAGNMRQELLRAQLEDMLPADAVDQLLPEGIGRDVVADAKDRRPQTQQRSAALSGPAATELSAALNQDHKTTGASNLWAIGPQLTETGGAILANDPHLGLSALIPWYLARIESPKLAVRGATVPGVPFMILGHNRHIAWGFTNTGADVQDLLVVEEDPDDSTVVHTSDGAIRLSVREETIDVRGGDPISITVRDSSFGPIVSDVMSNLERFAENGQAVALAFTALTAEDTTAASIFEINQASNWEEVRQAADKWISPPTNLAYADIDGRIGFTVIGNIPIRQAGDGLTPQTASVRQGAWQEFIAADALPTNYLPASGWISNANNDPAPAGYGPWLARSFEEGFRKRRIDQLIDGNGSQNLADSIAIQTDTVSLAALELLPLMMTINPQDPADADLFASLRTWDGTMDRNRPEPLVFLHWLRSLMVVLFEDELGDTMGRYMALRPTVVRSVLTTHQGWCDDTKTEAQETCQDALRLSLKRALLRLEEDHGSNRAGWRWGDEHIAALAHPLFSRLPLISSFGDLSRPTDGGPFTVNRGDTPVWNDGAPFAHTHGAGFRAVYDLADLDKSQFIIATGPSANPLSSFYGSMAGRWADGMMVSLAGAPEELSETGSGLLTLRPDID